MSRIRRCSSCGGKARLSSTTYGNFFYVCSDCGMKSASCCNKEAALRIWNKRNYPRLFIMNIKDMLNKLDNYLEDCRDRLK